MNNRSDTACFVLVSGLSHGGWCWRRVEAQLRAAGYDVFAPTNTGVGERSHLLSAEVGLSTFIDDICGLIDYEELQNVYLVGHSFGGMAATGVADRRPRALRHVIYLDAVVPLDGKCALDYLPQESVEARLAQAQAHDGGLSLPPADPTAFGVTDAEDIAWLRRRLTPHPMKTYTDAISLQSPPADGMARTYITCTRDLYSGLATTRDWLDTQEGWRREELYAAHDAMITAPRELSELLLSIAETES